MLEIMVNASLTFIWCEIFCLCQNAGGFKGKGKDLAESL